MNTRYFFFVFLAVLLFSCKNKKDIVINTDVKWKFKTGDSILYAKPEYDDSSWDSISPDMVWELQGYSAYNGIGWYRLHFFLPEKMKKNAWMKDSIQIVVGQVDDWDETYLNGEILGQNGLTILPDKSNLPAKLTGSTDAYRLLRKYVLSVTDPRLRWNQENVLAVRAIDFGGGGGIYGKAHGISMIDLKDYLQFNAGKFQVTLKGNNQFQIKTALVNTHGSYQFKGILKCRIVSADNQQTVFDTTVRLSVLPQNEQEKEFLFTADQTKRHTYFISFRDQKSGKTFSASAEMPYILTPPAPEEPRINGAGIIGVRPGNEFLFYIPVTGSRPLTYKAKGLPQGLSLDSLKGIITGRTNTKGEYRVLVEVSNSKGTAKKEIRIVVGDKIALTPPMGWNSWNCWGLSVDDRKVRDAADQFVNSGLIDHGWTYINIDDGWEAPERAKNGEIVPNEKFPDMKGLTDYVHSKGLRFGIYSSPGPLTCGGYLGSYQHEMQDAKSYARWGIDYLKYDWCSYGRIARDNSLEELKKPYLLMRKCLDRAGRDIVFSLCQYGMGEVWKWGHEVGGDCWRTTGDIEDTWESMSNIGFSQDVCAPYTRPGYWNDPDMLVVGWVGWGPSLHPTHLTPSEQYTHISLWCLLSAPLLIGCDLTKLDDFTLNLLTNDEVLAVNQDPAANPAKRIVKNENGQIWVKLLEDGSYAVGLFNTSEKDQIMTLSFRDLNLSGKHRIRDLWRQKDSGNFTDEFECKVPAHGAEMIRIFP
jgi:hypothetical protein